MTEFRTEHLPYELTAEQLAKEQMDRLYDKYGYDPPVLMRELRRVELKQIIHEAIELGLGIAEVFGDTGPTDMLEAFSAGLNYRNEGE